MCKRSRVRAEKDGRLPSACGWSQSARAPASGFTPTTVNSRPMLSRTT